MEQKQIPKKFRVWVSNELDTGMYYPKVIQIFEKGTVDRLWTDTHKFSDDIDEMILMQFSGLKDKNGKDIYEGDILDYSEYEPTEDEPKFGYVIFSNGQFTLNNIEDFFFFFRHGHPEWQQLPIVGNIYENPELCPKPKS